MDGSCQIENNGASKVKMNRDQSADHTRSEFGPAVPSSFSPTTRNFSPLLVSIPSSLATLYFHGSHSRDNPDVQDESPQAERP
jgi:hypothetical protein